MQILIADDSVVSRHLLEVTLRKWGYEVVIACDGEEALDILQKQNAPTLAVLDWMMPGLTGPEVCRRIRERRGEPYAYILLLTSRNQREDVIEGMGAGADDYIAKPFDQHELQVRLRAGIRLLNLQTELVAAREALREEATRDSLTRLWNRTSILDTLGRELARGLSEGRPVSVLMADLDHFKNINDNYGHLAGDAVLCAAARHMQSAIRSYDSIGRFGGEEFLVLLPGCNEQDSFHQAERLRHKLSQTDLSAIAPALSITASFGAATAHPGRPCAAEALIRTADEALYQAKRSGRNRVECLPYNPELPAQTRESFQFLMPPACAAV